MSKESGDYVPQHGWVVELEEAKAAAKAVPGDAKAHLRVTCAYQMLRQWRKCMISAEIGLSLSPDAATSEKLKDYRTTARAELATLTKSKVNDMKELFADALKGDCNLDQVSSPSPGAHNSNLLQAAALAGDLRLMEAVVAHGAAIDHPFLSTEPIEAPTSATALVIVCANLVVYSIREARAEIPHGSEGTLLRELFQGQLECAKQLVRLGADTKVQLVLPSHGRSNYMDLFSHYKLGGKTAAKLAALSKKQELTAVMKEFKEPQMRLSKVHCRCGSQLPWKQCHSGGIGSHPHYLKDSSTGRIDWCYSPLAPCLCKLTSKCYYDCCWTDSVKPLYQNDRTGEVHGQVLVKDPSVAQAVKILDTLGAPSRDEAVEFIREAGLGRVLVARTTSRKSIVIDWDPRVVAGCVERIDEWFIWDDLHWHIERAELLKRVEEWNAALEQYCDSTGLTGSAREAVLAKHTATPFAPCANPDCSMMEKELKEFQRCSRCRRVAYCCRECQRSDWRHHKKHCC